MANYEVALTQIQRLSMYPSFTAATRVRVPSGMPKESMSYRDNPTDAHRGGYVGGYFHKRHG